MTPDDDTIAGVDDVVFDPDTVLGDLDAKLEAESNEIARLAAHNAGAAGLKAETETRGTYGGPSRSNLKVAEVLYDAALGAYVIPKDRPEQFVRQVKQSYARLLADDNYPPAILRARKLPTFRSAILQTLTEGAILQVYLMAAAGRMTYDQMADRTFAEDLDRAVRGYVSEHRTEDKLEG